MLYMKQLQLFKALWGDDDAHIKFICYGGKGKPPNKQIPFTSIKDGLGHVSVLVGGQNNIYHTPALFLDDKRTKKSFMKCKALWADLDVKKMPSGQTLNECALQLTRLEDPFIGTCWVVFTGHGFHAYWILDRFLCHEEWSICAKYLEAQLKAKAIKFDSITADCSRMLRTPGTYNYKDKKPVLARVIKNTGSVVSANNLLKLASQSVTFSFPKLPLTPKEDDVISQLASHDFPPSKACLIADKCAFIKQFSIDGFHENEPAWNAAVNALRLCDDGHEAIHKFSSNSAQYKEEETASKIQAKEKINVAPTTCDYIRQFGFCGKCPYKNKVTVPIQLGFSASQIENKAVGIDKQKTQLRAKECISYVPKEPWRVGKEGIFLVKDGVLGLICAVPLLIIDLIAEDFNDATILTAIIHALTPHKPTTFKLPLKLLADSKKFMGEFNARKIFPVSAKKLALYIQKYVSNLEKANIKPQIAVNSLGWQKAGSFVYSSKGNAVQKNGDEMDYIFDSKVKNFIVGYNKKGSLAAWHEIFNLYAADEVYIPHLFSLLCAIGTPLLRYTSARGIVLSLCSCSGSGKTLAHKVAMAVWGDPEIAGILGTHDTHNALIGRMAAVKNLPLRLDEITILPPKLLSGLIYELVNGKGRARATLDGSLSGVANEWQTLTLVSTNASLLDQDSKILSEAERNRVLELPVKMPHNIIKTAKILSDIIADNHGIIGSLFVKDMVTNLEKWKDFIDKFQIATSKQVDSSKRFWVSCGAIAFAAVKFCLRLGFNVNKEALLRWFCSFLEESEVANEKSIKENRGFDTLDEMVVSLRDSLEGSIKVINKRDNSVIFSPLKAVLAYIVRDMNDEADYLYVRYPELKTFLRGHYQESVSRVIDDLGIRRPKKSRRIGGDPIWAYEFKLRR